MFANTVFTAAVAFYAGLVPGLATIIINRAFRLMLYGSISLFIIVSIAEVIIICLLKPDAGTGWPGLCNRRALAETVSVLAKLMLLYIATSVTASVLGGLIEYYHFVSYYFANMERYWQILTPEDVFRAGFYGSETHKLAIGIFSRIPVNLIDRAAVIFGGYFIALGIGRLGTWLTATRGKGAGSETGEI